MAGMIDGLKSATASMAYSMVKQAPMNNFRGWLKPESTATDVRICVIMLFKDVVKIGVAGAESSLKLGEALFDLLFGKGQNPLDDIARPLDIARAEKPRDHATAIGLQSNR